MQDKCIFQILDWNEYQYYDENDDCDDDSENENVKMKKFIIRIFGKTKNQESVYLEVTDFKPYFYIEIKNTWNSIAINTFLEEVKKNVWKNNVEGLISHQLVKKHRFYGFTNYTKFSFLQLNFENMDAFRAYERALKKTYNILSLSKHPIKVKIYESNLPPMMRLMHIQKLNAVGWVSIDNNKLTEDTHLTSCCDLNYRTKWTNINPIEEHTIEKYIILSFDIECTSKDGSFPQAMREEDKIIQIGMTLSRFGEDDCYEKHLLSLGETADIEGINVLWFNTEIDLLLAFTKKLRELNPDIITGYNIFGFDFKYIHGRILKHKLMMYEKSIKSDNKDITQEELNKHFDVIINGKNSEYFEIIKPEYKHLKNGNNFTNKFEKLSRIDDEISTWEEKVLASSALGENLLYYYNMTGRVIMDLMKIVQRDYKLSSYKLDYVASSFIRENITNISKLENKKCLTDSNSDSDFISGEIDKIKINKNTFKIETKSTFGLTTDNYITIGYTDGAVEERYEEGRKFKIKELDKKYMIVSGNIDTSEFMGKGFKVFWSQAKDDISPKDIFAMCDGTPKDRAIIGKYCVQDCALCNKLIAKLQIITNNVGMANVCHVPLSFLFMRGQGIKIFSLVAKKCREKNHLIPVLKKPKAKEDDKSKNAKSKEAKKETKKIFNDDKIDDELEKHINMLNNKNKNDEEELEEDDGYEGAIVFIPKPGVYMEPIAVLDYASLYPNSMRLRNLSQECFVDDPTYDNIPGYKYHTITYKNNNGTLTTCKFAEKKDGTKGIIPEILSDLLNARKKYKKLMESESDYFKKSVLDGLQLAYKVTANSLYGQTGASTSPIFMKEIAASTTATGREMLQFSKQFIENIYSKLLNYTIYNDDKCKEIFMSEMHKTFMYHPTTFDVKDEEENDIQIHVNTEENELISDSKFMRKKVGYDVEYDNDGKYKFSENVMNIMDFNKIIERLFDLMPKQRENFYVDFKNNDIKFEKYSSVFGNIGINNDKELNEKMKLIDKLDDVTKSNLMENLEITIDDIGYTNKEQFYEKLYITMNKLLCGYSVNPEIIYGDSVTGDTPLLLQDENGRVFINTIEKLGKQWEDYIYGHSNKFQDKNINFKVWSNEGWTKINRVIKHKTNKKIYEVFTQNGCVKVTEDHSLLSENCEILKPNECKVGTKLLQSFPDVSPAELSHFNINFFAKFNSKKKTNFTKEYIYLQTQYLTLKQGSYKSENLSVQEMNGEYRLVYVENKNDCNNMICKIREIKYDGEIDVYDLETENHHFQAGIGEIIVHNTDSVFFCPHIKNTTTGELQKDKNALCMSIRMGIWASIMITTLLPSPMAQEYEKVLWPFIIQGKKRYVGNLYEKNPNSFKQKSMGIELKRRDNAPIVKTVSAGIIHKILNEHDPEGAFDFMKDILEKIINEQFKMDKFVITKTLRGNALTKEERKLESVKPKEQRSYADRTRIVHAVLADRMADRDPGSKPLSNDRIPYAYVELKYEPELQGDRVETPDYIRENKLKLDYLFYITNQIMKPALKFLDLITTNANKLFKDYIAREENRKRGMLPLSFYNNNSSKEDIDNICNKDYSELNITKEKTKKKTQSKKNNTNNNESLIKTESLVWFDDF